MIVLVTVVLLIGYGLVATRACAGGARRLWLTAVGALLLVVAVAGLAGQSYAVPSVPRLVLYVVAFTGPVVVVPTLVLSWRMIADLPAGARLAAAVIAGCVGLAGGFFLTVFGVGVW